MRAKKCVSILVAASLATTMLTGCPWEKEEAETDDASSVPVTSADTSQDDDDHDSGDDDGGQEEDKLTKENIEIKQTNCTVQVGSVDSGDADTYTITFTATPTAEKYIANNVSVEGATKDGGTFSGNWSAAGSTAAFAHASAVVTIKPDDDYETFTVTGIPADATSCIISVTFEDLGYVIENGAYMVHNADGLLAWAQSKDVLTTDCTLTANIDLTDQNWTPIGSYSNYGPNDGYTGIFDGGGHTISGLQISSTGNNIGLFGRVNGGTVENLNLANVSVSGYYYVGGVVGSNYATITGCYWQVGTDDSPSQGVGSGNDGTTQVVGGWSSITDNAFTSRLTVDNTTHKPVPVNIRTSTGNTVVDTVLDAARVFWP